MELGGTALPSKNRLAPYWLCEAPKFAPRTARRSPQPAPLAPAASLGVKETIVGGLSGKTVGVLATTAMSDPKAPISDVASSSAGRATPIGALGEYCA